MTSSRGRTDGGRVGYRELEGTRCNQRRAVNWLEEPGPGLPWVGGNVRNVSLVFFFLHGRGKRKGGGP